MEGREGKKNWRLPTGEARTITRVDRKQGDDMYNRAETIEEERREGLHEPSSTALCVDFLESLFLLSLQPAISPYIFATTDLRAHTSLITQRVAMKKHKRTAMNP